MLHTGTMFAVIVYFWKAWKRAFFSSRERFERVCQSDRDRHDCHRGRSAWLLKFGIEHYLSISQRIHKGGIEELFKHLEILAVALAAAGVLILYSGLRTARGSGRDEITSGDAVADRRDAGPESPVSWILAFGLDDLRRAAARRLHGSGWRNTASPWRSC